MIELNLISKFVGHALNIKEMRLMDMISLTSLELIKLQEKKSKFYLNMHHRAFSRDVEIIQLFMKDFMK